MCSEAQQGPFSGACQYCGFDIAPLAGTAMSPFQEDRWAKHWALAHGETIPLSSSGTNSSFYPAIVTEMYDRIRYTSIYRHEATWTMGNQSWPVWVTRFNEPIGLGTYSGLVKPHECHSLVVVSPNSKGYGHAFPALDEWISGRLQATHTPICKVCGKVTTLGVTICTSCFKLNKSEWYEWLNPGILGSSSCY